MTNNKIIDLDYYYGKEADQFSFYRVPKLLVKDERFKGLTSDAKLLYGLMLDRLSLSMKNGWLDDQNRAYIYYTMDEIMDDLGCAREKCAKIISEIDDKKGVGLIKKIRQGLGKPDIIYVMNFASEKKGNDNNRIDDVPTDENMTITEENVTGQAAKNMAKEPSNPDVSTEVRKSNFKKFENRTSRNSEIELQEIRKSNYQKFENQTSRSSEIETQEVRKPNSNYTNINNTDISYINNNYTDNSDTDSVYNQSIYQSQPRDNYADKSNRTEQRDIKPKMDRIDTIDEIDKANAYMELVKENLDYDNYIQNADRYERKLFMELYEIICEIVSIKRATVRIGQQDYPYELVKSRFMKLTSAHLEYVIECMKNNTAKIGNIKAYLITALFNSVATIDHYYQNEVKSDMWG